MDLDEISETINKKSFQLELLMNEFETYQQEILPQLMKQLKKSKPNDVYAFYQSLPDSDVKLAVFQFIHRKATEE